MVTHAIAATDMQARLAALGELLRRRQPLWRHRPFASMPAPWERDHPQVARWLRNLSDDACDRLHAQPSLLGEGPAPLAEWLREAQHLSELVPTVAQPSPPRPAQARMSPRKWMQVASLVRVLAPRLPRSSRSLVDWCSGKGHLGRTLARETDRPVLFVERSESLCREAVRHAEAEGVSARATTTDVLLAPPAPPNQAAIAALHACGALGDAALRTAAERGIGFVALAPCCYHHQPRLPLVDAWSEEGRGAQLELEANALRFATAEEVIAAPRRRRRRRRAEAFRLGLDSLLREASGIDRYTRVPALPTQLLDGSFDAFVRGAAEQHGLTLPSRFDARRSEQRGWELASLAAKLSLVRVIYRRAVELWLVLDRALWLGSREFDVEVTTFCDASISPRNLLIVGKRGHR